MHFCAKTWPWEKCDFGDGNDDENESVDWRCCCCCCWIFGRWGGFRRPRLEWKFLWNFLLLTLLMLPFVSSPFLPEIMSEVGLLRLRLEEKALELVVSDVVDDDWEEDGCRFFVPSLPPTLPSPARLVRSTMGLMLLLLLLLPLLLLMFWCFAAFAFWETRFPGIPQRQHCVAASSSLSYVQ